MEKVQSQIRVASNPLEILQHGSDLCRGSTRRDLERITISIAIKRLGVFTQPRPYAKLLMRFCLIARKNDTLLNEMNLDIEFIECHPIFEVSIKPVRFLDQCDPDVPVPF